VVLNNLVVQGPPALRDLVAHGHARVRTFFCDFDLPKTQIIGGVGLTESAKIVAEGLAEGLAKALP
jgi:hypothetical protein